MMLLCGWAVSGCEEGAPSAPVVPAKQYRVEVVRSIPHDPGAFTQGLCFLGDRLFESTGKYGASTVRELDLQTGKVLRKEPIAPRYFGEGLAAWGDELVQLSWKSGAVFRYRADDFSLVRNHAIKGEGWGLTADGTHWIQSDGSATLTFRSKDSFKKVRTVQVTDRNRPVTRLNELEWVDGEVWANVYLTDRIVRIDPQSGRVVGWIDAKGLVEGDSRDKDKVLNGIAVHPTTGAIYLTGKKWDALFEVRVVEKTPSE